MATTFKRAPRAVYDLAEDVIASYHPELHQAGARVEFIMRSEARRGGGKITLGSARKVVGKEALYATEDAPDSEGLTFFEIELAADGWDLLRPEQQRALVDHELMHCGVEEDANGDPKFVLRKHDVEEFSDIIRRHGLWKPDLSRFFREVGPEQLSIFATAAEGATAVLDMEPTSSQEPGAPRLARTPPPRDNVTALFSIGGETEAVQNLLPQAARLFIENQVANATMIQRQFEVGFMVANSVMGELERLGVLGPNTGSKTREVLVKEVPELPELEMDEAVEGEAALTIPDPDHHEDDDGDGGEPDTSAVDRALPDGLPPDDSF